MSVAFLFPGQGSQQPGMLHDLPECAATAATLKEAGMVLARDILKLDSEVELRSTAAAQLALLIAGVAFGRALLAEGAIPKMVGGLSVGSFAAAVIADSLDFSPLLEPVADELDRAMAGVLLRPPKYVYVGNRGGRPLRDSASVRRDLVSNVAHAVRWHDATTLMVELGARLFVELPPGRTLANLAAASFPEARATACGGSRIDFIAQLVRRHQTADEN
jgi:malonyl CoA-acyl carrier protein transacylase